MIEYTGMCKRTAHNSHYVKCAGLGKKGPIRALGWRNEGAAEEDR